MLKNYSKIDIDEYGNKHYLNDKGKEHRLDGPAVENSYGTKLWCINEKSHQNIGPSYEYLDGTKYWFFNNKLHRIGGFVNSNIDFWYICGKRYTKEDYFNIVWNI